MKSEIKKLRNELYDSLPTGSINAFDLLKIIRTHLDKLDSLVESNDVCYCVEDMETGVYESIHKTKESAEKEILDWKDFKTNKHVTIVEREIK